MTSRPTSVDVGRLVFVTPEKGNAKPLHGRMNAAALRADYASDRSIFPVASAETAGVSDAETAGRSDAAPASASAETAEEGSAARPSGAEVAIAAGEVAAAGAVAAGE